MGNTCSHGLEKQHLKKKTTKNQTAVCYKCSFPLSTAQGEKGEIVGKLSENEKGKQY